MTLPNPEGGRQTQSKPDAKSGLNSVGGTTSHVNPWKELDIPDKGWTLPQAQAASELLRASAKQESPTQLPISVSVFTPGSPRNILVPLSLLSGNTSIIHDLVTILGENTEAVNESLAKLALGMHMSPEEIKNKIALGMRVSEGEEILGSNDPRSAEIAIIYVAPNDKYVTVATNDKDKKDVLTAILEQEELGRKQVAVVLPEDNEDFNNPQTFEDLKNKLRGFKTQIVFVAPDGPGSAEFARQRRFSVYSSLGSFARSLQTKVVPDGTSVSTPVESSVNTAVQDPRIISGPASHSAPRPDDEGLPIPVMGPVIESVTWEELSPFQRLQARRALTPLCQAYREVFVAKKIVEKNKDNSRLKQAEDEYKKEKLKTLSNSSVRLLVGGTSLEDKQLLAMAIERGEIKKGKKYTGKEEEIAQAFDVFARTYNLFKENTSMDFSSPAKKNNLQQIIIGQLEQLAGLNYIHDTYPYLVVALMNYQYAIENYTSVTNVAHAQEKLLEIALRTIPVAVELPLLKQDDGMPLGAIEDEVKRAAMGNVRNELKESLYESQADRFNRQSEVLGMAYEIPVVKNGVKVALDAYEATVKSGTPEEKFRSFLRLKQSVFLYISNQSWEEFVINEAQNVFSGIDKMPYSTDPKSEKIDRVFNALQMIWDEIPSITDDARHKEAYKRYSETDSLDDFYNLMRITRAILSEEARTILPLAQVPQTGQPANGPSAPPARATGQLPSAPPPPNVEILPSGFTPLPQGQAQTSQPPLPRAGAEVKTQENSFNKLITAIAGKPVLEGQNRIYYEKFLSILLEIKKLYHDLEYPFATLISDLEGINRKTLSSNEAYTTLLEMQEGLIQLWNKEKLQQAQPQGPVGMVPPPGLPPFNPYAASRPAEQTTGIEPGIPSALQSALPTPPPAEEFINPYGQELDL